VRLSENEQRKAHQSMNFKFQISNYLKSQISDLKDQNPNPKVKDQRPKAKDQNLIHRIA
jgi:hypothetical protein